MIFIWSRKQNLLWVFLLKAETVSLSLSHTQTHAHFTCIFFFVPSDGMYSPLVNHMFCTHQLPYHYMSCCNAFLNWLGHKATGLVTLMACLFWKTIYLSDCIGLAFKVGDSTDCVTRWWFWQKNARGMHAVGDGHSLLNRI